ncbi:MAG: cytochrome c3 family protein [Bacillota bacterium]|nr:cytochrome c3 family protein [Bacillota bacterium]
MRRLVLLGVLVCTLVLAGQTLALAAGPHDALNCTGCHSIHYAVGAKAFAVNNDKVANPRGDSNVGGVSALCLGCHEETKNGGAGIKPISVHRTHPIYLVPNNKIAKVPPQLLVNGRLECTSCHDPHPSNPAYRYLRVDTKGGAAMGAFCAACHPAKVDLASYGLKSQDALPIFSSMDESKGALFAPAAQITIHNETPNYIKPPQAQQTNQQTKK